MKKYLLGALMVAFTPVWALAAGVPVGCLAGFNFSPITGERCSVAVESSLTKECFSFNRDLQFGDGGATVVGGLSKEPDVKALQEFLVAKGFGGTAVNGEMKGGSVFGEATAAAVVKFQGAYGIRQTGYVGPLTRGKLNVLCVQTSTTVPVSDDVAIGDNDSWLSAEDYTVDSGDKFSLFTAKLPAGAVGFGLKATCKTGGLDINFISSANKDSDARETINRSFDCGDNAWVKPSSRLNFIVKNGLDNRGSVAFQLNAYDKDGNWLGADEDVINVDGVGEEEEENDDQDDAPVSREVSLTLAHSVYTGTKVTKSPIFLTIGSAPANSNLALKIDCSNNSHVKFQSSISGQAVQCGSNIWVSAKQQVELRYVDYLPEGYDEVEVTFTLSAFDAVNNSFIYSDVETTHVVRGKG